MGDRTIVLRGCALHQGGPRGAHPARINAWRHACTLAMCLAVAGCAVLFYTPGAARGANPLGATTSRAARADAIRSVPQDKLDPAARRKVSYVLSEISIYRRMPTQVIRCDPDLYLFMVNHPHAAVNMWEVLGVSQLSLERTGETTFQLDDHQGTIGNVEILYSSPELHLVYARGAHTGALFSKPVRGSGLMLLKSGYVRETNGDCYITCQLDVFVRVDHLGAELIAKTLQPLVGKVADYNFLESSAFVSSLSRTAEVKPQAAQTLTERLARVSEDDRAELSRLLTAITQDAELRRTRRLVGVEADLQPEILPTTKPKPLGVPLMRR